MCRRYAKEIPRRQKHREYLSSFDDATDPEEKPKYNVSPGSDHNILGTTPRNVVPSHAEWGFNPPRQKGCNRRFAIARSETASRHKLFKDAFSTRRCVTWATGYYIWHRTGRTKKPYLIHFYDRRPFYIFGIWQAAKRVDDDETFAILTTRAVDNLTYLDDRMPCIADLNSPNVDHWLNPKLRDSDFLLKLLQPSKRIKLVATRVSSYVNNAANRGARCIEPLKETGWLF